MSSTMHTIVEHHSVPQTRESSVVCKTQFNMTLSLQYWDKFKNIVHLKNGERETIIYKRPSHLSSIKALK